MGDNNLIPLSDEQAKLVRAAGGYLADIFGDLPKDLLGLLVGDRVKAKRLERAAIIWANTKKRLEEQGVIEPEPPSLKLALPILAAAADENREELLKLWEGLLAAAMNPKRQDLARQSLISTVKEMDAFDALVLKLIADHGEAAWVPTNGRDEIAKRLKVALDDVVVSLDNLFRLNLIRGPTPIINPFLAPLGNLLMRAIA